MHSLDEDCGEMQYKCMGSSPKCISSSLVCDGDYNCGSMNRNEENSENGCFILTTTIPTPLDNPRGM